MALCEGLPRSPSLLEQLLTFHPASVTLPLFPPPTVRLFALLFLRPAAPHPLASLVFTKIYGQSVGIAGTNFIAQGLGFFLWAQIQGRLLDVVYRKLKARYGGEGKPEYRLPMMIPASIFLPFGLLLYGWGAQHHLHWIIPDIGLAFIAGGMIGNFQCMTTYLIDVSVLSSFFSP
jgi:hypothetical protein